MVRKYVRLKDPEARETVFNTLGMLYLPVKDQSGRLVVDLDRLSAQARDRLSRMIFFKKEKKPDREEIIVDDKDVEPVEECEKCGGPVGPQDAYCPNCGWSTGRQPVETVSPSIPQPVARTLSTGLDTRFQDFEETWREVLEFIRRMLETFGFERAVMVLEDGKIRVSFAARREASEQ